MSGAVLITGAASGIGRATVDAVLACGWKVAAFDLPGPSLDALGEAFDPADVRCAAVDVVDEDAVAAAVASIEVGLAPLVGAVNAAGVASGVPVMDVSLADFRRILDVNVIGSFVVGRQCARVMGGRGGSIVNVGSVSGIQGNVGRAAYGASKGAVVTMSRVMAVELASRGIRVNVIAPGPVETPMVREIHSDAERAAWTSRIPLARYGSPEEIAAAAVFLLDPTRSSFITGQTLSVDGGFTIAGIVADRGART